MNQALTAASTRASLLACASLSAASTLHAANQVWIPAPVDAAWASPSNWVGGAAPGTAAGGYGNATRNNDVATFNSALGTIFGGEANPVLTDANRFLKGITFDSALAGAHVIGVSGGEQLQLDQGGLIQINAPVVLPQKVNADIRVRAQSSFNPAYFLRNNASLPTATLSVGGVLQVASSTGRGVNWTLDGTNTGDNVFNGSFSTTAGNGTGGFTALTKAGTGTWRVTGTNTLPSVAVTEGLLIADGPSALGTAGVTVSGGTLAFENLALGNSVVVFNGTGTLRAAGASSVSHVSVSNAAPSTSVLRTVATSDVLTIGTGTTSVTDGQAGSVLTVAGPGTIVLGAAGTYTGTWSLDSGILRTDTFNALGTSPSVAFGDGSTGLLRMNGYDATISGLSSSANAGSAAVENGGTYDITLTTNPTAAVAFHGVIRDGGTSALALDKGGSGSLALAGNNTYTGGTRVHQGTLLAVNSAGSATGSGTVTVSGTGVLGGTGSISGTVAVATGGKVSPGTGVGTLTVGRLELAAGSQLDLEFAGGNDKVHVTSPGGLTVNGGSVTVHQEGSANPFTTPGTYPIISYSGTLGGSVSSLTVANQQPGFSYSFAASGGQISLTISTTGAVRNWTNPAGGSWAASGNWSGVFPNAAGDSANFTTNLTGGPAIITLDGNRTVGGLTFHSPAGSYTINQGSGGSLILNNGSSGSAILNGAGVHFLNVPVMLTTNTVVDTALESDAITLANPVSGGGTLTKSGSGSLALLGANTFAGKLSLTGGTTTFANGGLGAGSLSIGHSMLVWSGGNTQDISNRSITFTGGVIGFNTNGNNVTLANAIGASGTGDFVKSGEGRLTLAADATFTGLTTVAAGTLQLGNGGTTGLVSGDVVNNGTLVFNLAGNADFYGNISGTGEVIHAGSGELALGGTNPFTGTTRISQTGASLALLNSLALQGSTLVYPAGGGRLAFDTVTSATLGALEGDHGLALTNSFEGAVALTVGGNGASTSYGGVISGTDASFVKVGAGTMTMSGLHTYTGATAVNGGVLRLEGGGINTTSLNIGSGSRLEIDGATVTSGVFSTFQNGGIGISLISGSLAFNGGVQSSQNDGSLLEIWDGIFSATDVTLRRTLNYGNGGDPVPAQAGNGGLVVNGGVATITNALNVGTGNSGAGALVNGGDLTVGGVISIGNTTNNRWSMLEVRSGSLISTEATQGVVLSPHTATANRALFLVSGGTATVERVGFGTATSAVGGIGRVTVTGGTLYVGSGGLTQSAPDLTSQVYLSGGTLAAKADWSSSLPVTLSGISTLHAGDAANVAHSITLSGDVGGAGSLLKTGPGTVTLSGSHSYQGDTLVDQGTLSLSQATLSDTGRVEVSGTAVLHLAHAGIDVVGELRINGVAQPAGTYSAANTGGRITGTGSLRVSPSDPFLAWIDRFPGVGTLTGRNDDADKDGFTNAEEFALNGDPSNASASGKVVGRLTTVGTEQALVLTLPVRDGADFAGTTALSATVDGVIYHIGGSDDLQVFGKVVVEIPAISAGLPLLDGGWTYRSFRLSGAVGGTSSRGPKGFLRASVTAVP